MKRCRSCHKEKEDSEFYVDRTRRNLLYSKCKACMCKIAEWSAESYSKVQQFSRDEEYMVAKLAEKPTLSAALDNLYRRNPVRWHQVLKAAMLRRREQHA